MKVVVLGAGVIGVTTAWYLAKQGHRVTVIDREPASGLVTSFANGGQISVSQAEPWANPGAPAKIIKWLGREDAPLKFRLRADSRQWSWALRFLIECLPGRTKKNTLDILRLGIYSREKLQSLRAETGIQYDEVTRGILQIHTDEKEFSAACKRI
ncbi:MAG: FAD-dependent oxidoreductase, partial [Betaproteobacteria bacterium]